MDVASVVIKFKGTDPVTGAFYMGKKPFPNQEALDAWMARYLYLEVTVQA